jgi:ribosome-associated protein
MDRALRRESTGRTVENLSFTLAGDSIALCDLLKCAGLAASSGQGKHLVASGGVRVDGQPEARKTAKIRAGQVVELAGARLVVHAPPGPR